MNRRTFRIGLALLALVAFGLAGPLPAAPAADLALEGTATTTQSQGNRQSGVLMGSGTPLGNFTGTFSQRGNGNFIDGTATLVGNGGSVTLAFVGRSDPKTGVNTGSFRITGGTGRFAGATGSGTLLVFPGNRFTLLGIIN